MEKMDIFSDITTIDKTYSGFIMNKDTKVVRIENNKVINILEPKLSPLFFRRFTDFETWVVSRMIDSHRTNSRLLRKMLRLKNPQSLEVAMYSNCRTITDDFWFKEDGSELSFEDLRFKDDKLKNIALLGKFDSLEISDKVLTPELTNIGSFEKCWVIDSKRNWHLLKVANDNELFSEVFVSRLCSYLNYPCVDYNRVGTSNIVECKNFVDDTCWYEPMFSLIADNEDYIDNYKVLNRLGEVYKVDLVKEYLQILFVDALVQNPDRHTFNYGLIIKNGNIVKMAPNFDNNLALISKSSCLTMPSLKNPLIADFIDLVKSNKLNFSIPSLHKQDIVDLVNLTCKETQIPLGLETKSVVINLIWNNYNLLKGV